MLQDYHRDKEFDYFAFISYKREDEKWAKWLQKKLESYSLPTSIRKEKPNLPNKIRPVFRDQSELSGGNLKTEIEKGLNGSKYLIVICSPRSAKSPWVSREVQHFIDQGREEYIIPFIIEGTHNAANPKEECFPEGLRQLTGEKEILGININEMGRDAAAIKVIARMFDLRFDTLWQRHRKDVKKRRAYTILGIIIALITALVFVMVLWEKNSEIEKQNNQLTTLISNLKEENKTFSQMRNSTERYSYMGSLRGNDSEDWLMYLAYHPTEPIIAFSDDWGFWLHYIKTNAEVLLPGSDFSNSTLDVRYFAFTDDGSELVTSSQGGLFVWDVESLKLKKHITDFDELISESKEYDKYEDSDIFDNSIDIDSFDIRNGIQINYSDNHLAIITGDTALSTELYPQKSSSCISIYSNPVNNELLFMGDTRAALYDEEKNEFIQFFKGYYSGCSFSPRGTYLRLGKDLFERNNKIDTILPKKYAVKSLNLLPIEEKEVVPLKTDDYGTIEYHLNGNRKVIKVVKGYTTGNVQEILTDAHFVTPNKIVAIVGQGKHRVYNANTGILIGTLNNYVWTEGYDSYGYEQELSHAASHIVYSKIIEGRLYTVSTGGVIRIYDIAELRMDSLVELPFPNEIKSCYGTVSVCNISNDGTIVSYRFDEQPYYYECNIQSQ